MREETTHIQSAWINRLGEHTKSSIRTFIEKSGRTRMSILWAMTRTKPPSGGINFTQTGRCLTLACDGSYTPSTKEYAEKAGFGFIAINEFPHNNESSEGEGSEGENREIAEDLGTVLCRASGPVILDEDDTCFVGATRNTNNTAEITSFIESAIYARTHSNSFTKAKVGPDSTYALRAALGTSSYKKANQELASNLRREWRLTDEAFKGNLWYEKLKGHSHDILNDEADHLADRGAKGDVGEQGGRWAPTDNLIYNDEDRWVLRATRRFHIYRIDDTIHMYTDLEWRDDLVFVSKDAFLPYDTTRGVTNPKTVRKDLTDIIHIYIDRPKEEATISHHASLTTYESHPRQVSGE